MDYELLWQELITDPATIGYVDPLSASNDTTNAGLINDTTQSIPIDFITAQQLWENTDLTEYQALAAAGRQAYDVLISLENIDVRAGTNSRATLAALFPANSATRANLIALSQQTQTVSRASVIGVGRVYTQDIETARDRYGI